VRCEELGVLPSDRLFSPSAERNKAPISEVLSQVLPERGIVLEVGSGTGQHALQFARAMPNLIWQPSECDPDCLRSILAWLAVEEFPNVRPPVHLDVCALPWAINSAVAIVCINLIHIAPWSATKALFCGGRSLLSNNACVSTAPSRGRAGTLRRATGALIRTCADKTRNGAFGISMTFLASQMAPGSIYCSRMRCRRTI
jgi:hypothetical protein